MAKPKATADAASMIPAAVSLLLIIALIANIQPKNPVSIAPIAAILFKTIELDPSSLIRLSLIDKVVVSLG